MPPVADQDEVEQAPVRQPPKKRAPKKQVAKKQAPKRKRSTARKTIKSPKKTRTSPKADPEQPGESHLPVDDKGIVDSELPTTHAQETSAPETSERLLSAPENSAQETRSLAQSAENEEDETPTPSVLKDIVKQIDSGADENIEGESEAEAKEDKDANKMESDEDDQVDEEEEEDDDDDAADDDEDFVPDAKFAVDADDEPAVERSPPPESDCSPSPSPSPPPSPKPRGRGARSGSRASTAKASTKSKAKRTTKAKGTTKGKASGAADEAQLRRLFGVLDAQNNGRISARDVQRIADDHGLFYTSDELRDMVRFWDTTGTGTVDWRGFHALAGDAGFH